MNIVITGANRFIGTWLTNELNIGYKMSVFIASVVEKIYEKLLKKESLLDQGVTYSYEKK